MYELIFWNYQPDIYLNHHLVYEALCNQEFVLGLEELPIMIIQNRINNQLKNWEKVDDNSYKNTAGPGAFQIKTTSQSLKIDCYGTTGQTMNQLVAVLNEFKVPLYDPQVPERYDGFEEN